MIKSETVVAISDIFLGATPHSHLHNLDNTSGSKTKAKKRKKKEKGKKKKKITAQSIPMWSPTIVLTLPSSV